MKDRIKTNQEAQQAFLDAIERGFMTENPQDDNYAGFFMYMYTNEETGQDAFKHINTRQYMHIGGPVAMVMPLVHFTQTNKLFKSVNSWDALPTTNAYYE